MNKLFALLLLLVPSLADAKLHFTKSELKVPGDLLWFSSGDLDQDNQRDLVVSYRRGRGPNSERFIGVFFGSAEGFKNRPDLAFKAPAAAAMFDVGDAIDSPADDVLYLTSTGVHAQSFVDRKPSAPKVVVSTPSIIGAPEEEDLVAWGLFRKPGPMLVVPTRNTLKLFRREGDAWKIASSPRLDTMNFYDAEKGSYRDTRHGAVSGKPYAIQATTIVPNIHFVDQTGDGIADLVTQFEDRVAVYPGKADGTVTSTASFRRWFQVLTPDEVAARDTELDVQIVDMNNDGIADLSATKITGGIMNLRTETRLYRGTKGGGFDSAPTQTLTDDGYAALVRYLDVTGDGKVEMIQPLSSVSIVSLTRAMLSNEFKLDLRVRRGAQEGGFFEKTPSGKFESVLGLDFTVGGALRGAYPVFGADFDGDGLFDVIVPRGNDSMIMLQGHKKDVFDDDGNFTLNAPATRDTFLLPRAGGPPDVLMFYRATIKNAGTMLVFRARR